VVADGLRVLFCGINPGLMSAATGHHFARPGNRFWPVLHLSGFTPRLLRPRWLAVVGVTAYRAAFADRTAKVGPQERTIGDTGIWVLPNPSGLNAHWTPATMAEEFRRLREAADGPG
jgi:TDG/mug DNA glycosylase family protein